MSEDWQFQDKQIWVLYLQNHTFDSAKKWCNEMISEASESFAGLHLTSNLPKVIHDMKILFPNQEDFIKHIYEDEGQYLLAKKLKPEWTVHDPDGIWSSLGFYILLEPK